MRQVRDGEVNRLEVLFDRHQRALLHYFLHLTGNRAASEDLVQEAFFRVLKYRRSYQAENTFRAWLFQIGRNAYLDHLGRRKNEVAWAAEAPEARPTAIAAARNTENFRMTISPHEKSVSVIHNPQPPAQQPDSPAARASVGRLR